MKKIKYTMWMPIASKNGAKQKEGKVKRFSIVFLLFLVSITGSVFANPKGFRTLEIGDPAPDFTLPGVDGKTYTLADFSASKVLMVYFTGTHCPTSSRIEKRLRCFVEQMKSEEFAIVAINPNHPDGLREDEYGFTLYEETFDGSKRYAEDLGWDFPFLYDGEKQLAARAYGCLATPHVFIFDAERKLRYKGRFDDSRAQDPATVKQADAENATRALLKGEAVPVEVTRPMGCSTKWKERSAKVAAAKAERAGVPVAIEEIAVQGIAALRKNDTKKLRLIHLWASWCPPCVQEFPDLMAIQNRFGLRPFELITISLDEPEQLKQVKAFLEKNRAVPPIRLEKSIAEEGRTTNNYIFTGTNTDQLAEVLDPAWPGGMPYSILVAPGGEVIYRHSGKIDPVEVTTQILEFLNNPPKGMR